MKLGVNFNSAYIKVPSIGKINCFISNNNNLYLTHVTDKEDGSQIHAFLLKGLNKTHLSSTLGTKLLIKLPENVDKEKDSIEVLVEKSGSSCFKITKSIIFKLSDVLNVIAPSLNLLCSETLYCSGKEDTQ
jgi:hypothetical protein